MAKVSTAWSIFATAYTYAFVWRLAPMDTDYNLIRLLSAYQLICDIAVLGLLVFRTSLFRSGSELLRDLFWWLRFGSALMTIAWSSFFIYTASEDKQTCTWKYIVMTTSILQMLTSRGLCKHLQLAHAFHQEDKIQTTWKLANFTSLVIQWSAGSILWALSGFDRVVIALVLTGGISTFVASILEASAHDRILSQTRSLRLSRPHLISEEAGPAKDCAAVLVFSSILQILVWFRM